MVIRTRYLITLPILITCLMLTHTQASDLVSGIMATHTTVAFPTIAAVTAMAIGALMATTEATEAATAIVEVMPDRAVLQEAVAATVTVLADLVEGASAAVAEGGFIKQFC